jgi:hypothetical protein
VGTAFTPGVGTAGVLTAETVAAFLSAGRLIAKYQNVNPSPPITTTTPTNKRRYFTAEDEEERMGRSPIPTGADCFLGD